MVLAGSTTILIPFIRLLRRELNQYFQFGVGCSDQTFYQTLFASQIFVLLLWYGDYYDGDTLIILIPGLFMLATLVLLDTLMLIWIVVVLIFLRRTERDLLLRSAAITVSSLVFFSATFAALLCVLDPKIRTTALAVAIVAGVCRGAAMITCSDHQGVL